MTRTGGDITKQKILEVAEKLFSKNGFDAASVESIAKTAKVNKALIYYHFKDKHDILVSIMNMILEDLESYLTESFAPERSTAPESDIKAKIRAEIDFLEPRKDIVSIMLMESLKSNDNNLLFKCAEMVFSHENKSEHGKHGKRPRGKSAERFERLMHEFYTGFIPVISFVAMKDKWCSYFKCSPKKATDIFIDSFERSHLMSHH